jgi:hypothetical protein
MLSPEEEMRVLEGIEREKARGVQGLTMNKVLWAKHVLDSQDVPTEGRMVWPPADEEED